MMIGGVGRTMLPPRSTGVVARAVRPCVSVITPGGSWGLTSMPLGLPAAVTAGSNVPFGSKALPLREQGAPPDEPSGQLLAGHALAPKASSPTSVSVDVTDRAVAEPHAKAEDSTLTSLEGALGASSMRRASDRSWRSGRRRRWR